MFKSILFSGAALAGMLVHAPPAQAVSFYASGATTASSPGGATPLITFTAPGGEWVGVVVTDCCIGGDYYATYLDGSYLGTTPFEPEYGSQVSSATFFAKPAPGSLHTLQMFDQTDFLLPAGLDYEVFQPLDFPEPASWALMLVGAFGLGGALRARRRTADRTMIAAPITSQGASLHVGL